MVRETVARAPRPGWRLHVHADAVMKDNIQTDLAPEPISMARCRELLGDEALPLSHEDVHAIRRHADAMAHVLVEIFLANEPRA